MKINPLVKLTNRMCFGLKGVNFLFINILAQMVLRLPELSKASYSICDIVPFRNKFLSEIEYIYYKDVGHRLSCRNRILLLILGRKICYVAMDLEKNIVVGFALFYFNLRDIKERTIHIAYLGIKKDYRRNGIGSILMEVAIKNYNNTKAIKGISSRVISNNLPAVMWHKSLGFSIIERNKGLNRDVDGFYLKKNIND